MIGSLFAHVGGIPIEETVGPLGPALLAGFGVAWATLRARLRPAAASRDATRAEGPTTNEYARTTTERRVTGGSRTPDKGAEAWL